MGICFEGEMEVLIAKVFVLNERYLYIESGSLFQTYHMLIQSNHYFNKHFCIPSTFRRKEYLLFLQSLFFNVLQPLQYRI